MHRLSGRWTSRVFNHPSGSIPIERDDGWFDLVIDDAGTVLAGSRHTRPDGSTNVITGRAEPDGLILEEVLDVAGTTMTFFGIVLVDGLTQKLLIGEAAKTSSRVVLTGQEEGTWVATQP